MKTRTLTMTAIGLTLALFTACGDKEKRMEKKMSKGFALPKGDAEKGKQAFIELNCHSCHTVAGEVLPEVQRAVKAPNLGGEFYRVKTYGELVTSVINPKHMISKDWEGETSPMPVMNTKMTVDQMVNIVEYLNARYVKLQPEYEVPYYGP